MQAHSENELFEERQSVKVASQKWNMEAQPMKNAFVTIAAALLFCSILMAQDNEETRKSLKGLAGVYVSITLAPNAAKIGLSEKQEQVDVELRLRMAGIKVLTEEEWLKVNARPLLNVILGMQEIALGQGNYAHRIDISLAQLVTLPRNPQILISAETWRKGYVGVIHSKNIDRMRDQIKDAVDAFVNAWLSVNPKK
jgi:hypothetical protein